MLTRINIVPGFCLLTNSGRKYFFASLLLILCGFIFPATTIADDQAKYDLRAAYIYNFFVYISWPAHIENSPLKKIVICINADDKVFEIFNDSLKEKTIKKKNILTRRIRGSEDIPGCWVVYNSLSAQLVHVPADINTAGQGYLTIGENPDSMQESDIIRFYEENNKLRFEVSPSTAKTAGFTISSNLLRLAKIIHPAARDDGQEAPE